MYDLKKVIALIGFLVILTGCATYYYGGYVSPEKEKYEIKTIIVASFSTPKNQPNAGVYISDLITTQLLQNGFMIVNKKKEADAIITGAIGEYGYRNQNIDVDIEKINIFVGTQTTSLDEGILGSWLMKERPIIPVIAVTVKLIELRSKTILWAKNFYLSPSNYTLSEAAEELAQEIAYEISHTFK
jgi:TolB-like protein